MTLWSDKTLTVKEYLLKSKTGTEAAAQADSCGSRWKVGMSTDAE